MKEKRNKSIKNYKPIIQFLGIFVGIIVLYYILIIFINDTIFNSYIEFITFLAGNILKLFSDKVEIGNISLSYNTFSIIVAFGCEGTEPLIIFLAGVLAFPVNWKSKITGAITGITILLILNILRIVALAFIGYHYNEMFESFHEEIFPILFIIIAIILWLIWIQISLKQSKNTII